MSARHPQKQGPTGRQIRQKDIAAVAGVTRSTVSIILSGKSEQGHIAPGTRDRVLAVARTLGYQSNPLAQRLNGINSRIIGLHTYGDDMSNNELNYNAGYITGVQQRATELGYDLLLFTSSTHQEGASSAFPGGVNRLAAADGAIIISFRPDHAELSRLWSEGYKFVRIDRRSVPDANVPWVDSDHVEGTVRMAKALLDAGYERLLYVGGLDSAEPFLDRQAGFKRAMKELHLPKTAMVLMPGPEATPEWLRSTMTNGTPTIIAERWNHARLTAESAGHLGIDVPIAVLQSPYARWKSPLYCGYYVEPKVELGRRAVDLLVAQIEGRQADLDHVVQGHVQVQPAATFPAGR